MTQPYEAGATEAPDASRFPTLTPAQIARVAGHAARRRFEPGDILIAAGQADPPFLIVTEGLAEVLGRSPRGEEVITIHRAGQFTGELSLIAGHPPFVSVRAVARGEALELTRECLLGLVQVDTELSDILMRAFILRRIGLISRGLGDAVLIGSRHSPDTSRIEAFLSRNGHPYAYLDLDRDSDVQALTDRFQIAARDIPVVICRGELVLKNPTNQQVADCLGLNPELAQGRVHDVVIVGAGPSGLAAAVYAASEGLDVLVLETSAPGGQAGSSSKIENYLGFPTGISGQELAARASTQAQKFGAQLLIAHGARKLTCERRPFAIELDGGQRVLARSIVIATGAAYRKLVVDGLERFEGIGVNYVASFLEGRLCEGEEVVVVGGANSAGQAAVFLAETARRVHVLVRAGGLADTMSRYLIQRIELSPRITLHTRTEIVGLDGSDHLERVRWRDNTTGVVEEHAIGQVFVMTGAVPSTTWLAGCIRLDDKGFVKTGPSLSPDDLAAAQWPLARPPHLLETSVPGVFAVGDVRAGNLKRVAPAVGEGSMAVSFVHQVLHE